jgi:hypothetical protein
MAAMDLRALCREASEVVTHIDDKIRRKLLKRARSYDMTTGEAEVAKQVEAWKRAAKKTKRLS